MAAPDTESVWLEQGSQRFPLSEGTSVVGRAAGSQVHLNDDLVSRRHAEFKVDGLAVRVVDLASANGVYVNSRRIQNEAVLKDGDIVTIGRCQLRVRAIGPSGVGAVMSSRRTLTQVSDTDISQSGDGDTRTGTVFDLLGPVADKALRLGRVVEAERILGPALQTLLTSIRPETRVTDAAHQHPPGSGRIARGSRTRGGLRVALGGHHESARMDRLHARASREERPPAERRPDR